MIQLGEKIELEGFKDLEPEELTVVKKLVGNYANKFGEFTKLKFHLKNVHKTEASVKYEISGMLDKDGKIYNADFVNFNLYMVINKILDKLKKELN